MKKNRDEASSEHTAPEMNPQPEADNPAADGSEREEQKSTEHTGKKRKNTGLTIAILVCIGIMVFSGYKLGSAFLEYRRGTEEYDGLRQYAEVLPVSSSSEGEEEVTEEAVSSSAPDLEIPDLTTGAAGTHTSARPPLDIDWDSLKAINSDIVGWIYIKSLDLSYPVVHGTDDDYYLHRTFEKKDNFAGSIFVEYENKGDFSDPNTIVYGHNMKNGSMFGMLAHLESENLYRKDPWIWVMTPEGNYRYCIFSMYRPEVGSSTYTLFSGTDEQFTSWCEDMYNQSDVKLVKPTFGLDSKIITLSTCTTDSGHRFVVQGIAVK